LHGESPDLRDKKAETHHPGGRGITPGGVDAIDDQVLLCASFTWEGETFAHWMLGAKTDRSRRSEPAYVSLEERGTYLGMLLRIKRNMAAPWHGGGEPATVIASQPFLFCGAQREKSPVKGPQGGEGQSS